MRTTIMVQVAAAAVAGAALPAVGAAQVRTASDSPASVQPVLPGAGILLTVDGMSCPLCPSRLERVLAEMPEIDRSVIRFGEGRAYLRTRGHAPLPDAALRRAVECAGFALRGIRPLAG